MLVTKPSCLPEYGVCCLQLALGTCICVANSLFPHSSLDSLQFVRGQTLACSKVSYITHAGLAADLFHATAIGLPAVILASISTRESSGINSEGNSTLSWMGILNDRSES